MKRYQKKLLAHFLDILNNELGNAGCNDFWIDNHGLSDDEKEEFMQDYADHMVATGGWIQSDVEEMKDGWIADFCVVGMLEDAVRLELEDEGT